MNKAQEQILKEVKRNQHILIILLIVLLGPQGLITLLSSTPTITAFAAKETQEVNSMDPRFYFAIFFAVGALVYNVWGILNRSKEKDFKFSLKKTLITVIPPLAASFVAGWTDFASAVSPGDYVMTIFAGFGWAKAQNKIFKRKK